MPDELILPNGKKLGEQPHLASILVALGVPGAHHSKGNQDNAAAYEAHLKRIGQAAAITAVDAYLEANKATMVKLEAAEAARTNPPKKTLAQRLMTKPTKKIIKPAPRKKK